MGYKCIRPNNYTVDSSLEEAVFYDDRTGCVYLNKVDSNNYYSRYGKYPSSLYIELENWKANGIDSVLAFYPEEDIDTNTELKYQLSNDNGSKYLYYNGSNWIESVDPSDMSQWNTALEVDQNINTFPLLSDKQIKVRVLFRSLSRDKTPKLKNIYFMVRYKYDPIVDLLSSLKYFIETNLSAQFLMRYTMEESSDSFVLDTDFTNISIETIFNITTDPNQTLNIFSSYDPNTKTITLTSNANIDDILEISFKGSCPVVVQEDPELVDSVFPVIVIHAVDKSIENSMGSFSGDMFLRKISSDFSYVFKEPIYATSFVKIAVVCSNVGSSIFTAGALAALFEKTSSFKSLATGDNIIVFEPKPYEDHSSIRSNNNKKLLSLGVTYCDWMRDGHDETIEEITNIQHISLNMELMTEDNFSRNAMEEFEI